MKGRIGIIGGGLSGVVLARTLLSAGYEVEIYEKSRGPGGRLSTRRCDGYEFDHGAPYFTARAPEFREFLAPHLVAGQLAEWTPRLMNLGGAKRFKRSWFEPHYLAVPGMNAWVKQLSAGLNICNQWTVSELERRDHHWWLNSACGRSAGPFDLVCSTAPAEQSALLLPQLAPELSGVQMLPCYAWMLGFPGLPLGIHWDAAQVVNSPIQWMHWGHSRPGRPPVATLTIHSSNQWAQEHFHDPAEEVELELGRALQEACGIDFCQASSKSLHRWRYASTQRDLGRSYILHSPAGLAACGDWCLRGSVEGAYLSARRLAEAISS